jgi:hypothetical protein
MTRKRTNIVSKSLENYNLKETYLSIQISLDGFSFCVYHKKSDKYLAFVNFEFINRLISPENLLKPIEEIFENNILLQQEFGQVFVTHSNELATIVPEEFFDENNLSEYLKHHIKVLKTDFITFDHLKNNSAVTVFIPFVNINNFILSQFGSFEFNHTSSILIDNLSKLNRTLNEEQLFIHVNEVNFEVLCFKNGELLFYNNFSFQTAEDFIYYILFVIEQLKLNPETIKTTLLGAIEKESKLFKIAYQYIRELGFYTNENHQLTEEFNSLSNHAHYTMLNQF